jgi:hypothetical protein
VRTATGTFVMMKYVRLGKGLGSVRNFVNQLVLSTPNCVGGIGAIL